MDYISIYLQGRREVTRKGSERRWDACKLTHQYLLDALRAEIWWRLNGMCIGKETRSSRMALVEELSQRNAWDAQQQLRKCLPMVFHDDPEQQALFGRLLDLMDAFANLQMDTLQEYTLNERCTKAEDILSEIDGLRSTAINFPPLNDEWEIIIPLQLEGSMWQCATCRKNDNPRSMFNYLWDRTSLSEDAAEYNDGPMVRSDSQIQGGRIYFCNGTQRRCLYPFVQAGFNTENDEMDSLWLLKSLDRSQNGGCRGIDIMRDGVMDYRTIPEFSQYGSEQTNRYITLTGKVDSDGNTCPLRNRYDLNCLDWCSNLETIDGTIEKLKENLNTPDCSLIYLYGAGGVGKTAAVQKLLEEFDVPQKHHPYEYIIFLSAKKLEWSPTNGQTVVEYNDSKGFQSFRDLCTLRKALSNILGSNDDVENVQVPQQWNVDREQLYAGRSILLVLDDYESIAPESQQEIVNYLKETFYAPPPKNELMDPTTRFKRRQVIITCRESSIESLRADILLPRLDMREIIQMAKHFARRFGCLDSYNRAFGVDGMTISDAQERARERFVDLSYGKPLMILSLVRNYQEAVFPEKMPAERQLLEFLTRDTGRYLGRNDLCQALAIMAAYLADESGRNTIERLRFLWCHCNQQADYMDRNLELLTNYTVLQVDNEKRHFVFTSNAMQRIILENYSNTKRNRHDLNGRLSAGFGVEQGKMINIADDHLRLARWLSRDQHQSVAECLMHRLQRQIELLHDPELSDEFGFTDSDIGCLVDIVLQDDTVRAVAPCEYRKTLQMVSSVYLHFEKFRDIIYEKLDRMTLYDYPAEKLWVLSITFAEEGITPEIERDFPAIERDYIQRIRNVFTKTSDHEDRFVQFWAVLRLVSMLKELGYDISEDWAALIQEQLQVCMRKQAILSKTDLQLLRYELREVERLFRRSTIKCDSLQTANRMEGRQDQTRWFFKGFD